MASLVAAAAAKSTASGDVKTGVLLKRSRNRSALAAMTGVKWQGKYKYIVYISSYIFSISILVCSHYIYFNYYR